MNAMPSESSAGLGELIIGLVFLAAVVVGLTLVFGLDISGLGDWALNNSNSERQSEVDQALSKAISRLN